LSFLLRRSTCKELRLDNLKEGKNIRSLVKGTSASSREGGEKNREKILHRENSPSSKLVKDVSVFHHG